MGIIDKLYTKAVSLQKRLDAASSGNPVSAWWVQKRKQSTEDQKS